MGLEQTWNTTDPLFSVTEIDISLLLGKKKTRVNIPQVNLLTSITIKQCWKLSTIWVIRPIAAMMSSPPEVTTDEIDITFDWRPRRPLRETS